MTLSVLKEITYLLSVVHFNHCRGVNFVNYYDTFIGLTLVLQTDICEVCPNPLVLSQQLTHIELERLSMIGPEEFIEAFTVEKKLSVSSL